MKIEVLSSDSEDNDTNNDQDIELEDDASDDASQPPLQVRQPQPVPNTEQDSQVSVDIQRQAAEIRKALQHDSSGVVDGLHDLLTEVVKPLFFTTQHPDLTSTGRKNLITPGSSSAAAAGLRNTRSSRSGIFDPPPTWKNKWTMELLEFILHKHNDIPLTVEVNLDNVASSNARSSKPSQHKGDANQATRKAVLQSHFFLLVPPILNTIDSTDLLYKARGCHLLTLLCDLLRVTKSDMLRRTGLTDVFVDALRKNFVYLPTLTSEEDATLLLTEVYAAFLALIDARFREVEEMISLATEKKTESENRGGDRAPSQTKRKDGEKATTMSATQISAEITSRQDYLTTLLRQSLLYSLNHLSTTGLPTASAPTTSTSPRPSLASASLAPQLTIFLLEQLPLLTSRMGIYTAVHLPTLLPLLHTTLHDPFSTSTITGLHTLHASITAIHSIIAKCWPRIRQKWWTDILDAVVECWCNCCDELGPITHDGDGRGRGKGDSDGDGDEVHGQQRRLIRQIQGDLQALVRKLVDLVGDEMRAASRAVVDSDPDMAGLFE